VAVPVTTFGLGVIFTLAVAKGIDRADRRRQTVFEEVDKRPTSTVASLAKALKLKEHNVEDALHERVAVMNGGTVAIARAKMDDWGWLTVLDNRRPVGTIGQEALKKAAADEEVGKVLERATAAATTGSAGPLDT
jgi:hypothetical protein